MQPKKPLTLVQVPSTPSATSTENSLAFSLEELMRLETTRQAEVARMHHAARCREEIERADRELASRVAHEKQLLKVEAKLRDEAAARDEVASEHAAAVAAAEVRAEMQRVFAVHAEARARDLAAQLAEAETDARRQTARLQRGLVAAAACLVGSLGIALAALIAGSRAAPQRLAHVAFNTRAHALQRPQPARPPQVVATPTVVLPSAKPHVSTLVAPGTRTHNASAARPTCQIGDPLCSDLSAAPRFLPPSPR